MTSDLLEENADFTNGDYSNELSKVLEQAE